MTDSPTGRGTSGGVCVLCPYTVQITNPPMLQDAVIVPSRAIAGHVHTACKAGVVVISVLPVGRREPRAQEFGIVDGSITILTEAASLGIRLGRWR